jgi:hypothetical protein
MGEAIAAQQFEKDLCMPSANVGILLASRGR